jgi:hypothetical protein
MKVKIIKDGQEIDIKDLDKDFVSQLLKRNPYGMLIMALLQLSSSVLENSEELEKEEDLFTEENVNSLQVIEEEIHDGMAQCTGDPSNCSLCNNGGELIVDFSGALDALKEGYRVTRKSWVEKGKQRYLYFVPAATYPSRTDVARQEFGEEAPYSAYIALRTDLGYVTPYAITNPDLLAEDWLVISKDY